MSDILSYLSSLPAPVDDWDSQSELAFPDDGKTVSVLINRIFLMKIFQAATISINTTMRESR